jgi:hypothetical protein
MDLNRMFPKHAITGDMNGQGNFDFFGVNLTQLADSPRLDGTFIVKNGVITGIDLAETTRLMSRQHLYGGRTSYDEITGEFLLENHNQHLSKLNISSGLLSTSGTLDLINGKRLTGNFSVDLKTQAGKASLVLSGSIIEMNLHVK